MDTSITINKLEENKLEIGDNSVINNDNYGKEDDGVKDMRIVTTSKSIIFPLDKIIIIGAGGHSNVIIDTISSMNQCVVEAIFDDCYNESDSKNKNIKGTINDLINNDEYKQYKHFIAIGDNKIRLQIYNKLSDREYINIIHPSAIISNNVNLGKGNYIAPGTIINTNTNIGNFNIINTKASIDHDSYIGNFNHICPSVTICGHVNIFNNTMIGSGSTVIDHITIGNCNIIGSHSNVVKDILFNGYLFYGNPARMIKRII